MNIEKLRVGNEGSDNYYIRVHDLGGTGLSFDSLVIMPGQQADEAIAVLKTRLRYDTSR